ncbi:MAG: hypothetical protein DBY32_04720 [Phascolarctobacterium sp.]|nr:MAG: hypothetical protein DBY32_04720 [Phascolarctobacterium sp.]
MAHKLSTLAVIAKNELASDTPFIILLEIQLAGDDESIYICRNNEDVVWNGQLWQAFPFDLGEVKEDGTGSLPSIDLSVDNTGRALDYYLNQGGGGVNSRIILRVVIPSEDIPAEAEIEEIYSVTSTTVTEQYVKFSLGNAYPAQSRRPIGVYKKNACPFKYKGVECAATSDLPDCDHTLTACRERGNSKRFGGFAGIPQGGLYV